MGMANLVTLLANLDPDNNKRGKQFESICKWYLENEPCYKLQLKKIWLWKNWPQQSGSDIGIDLVAETNTGEFWAIQAKSNHPKYSINKKDVDTFLSASSMPVFSYRLLIATTNFIGVNAERTLRHQEKPIGRISLHNLERSDLDWPESPSELRPIRISPKKPLPHQQKAVNDVIRGFATSVRGSLIMACGTGKTLVGLWVSQALECERTLVLLPSLTLLAQTLREWCSNASRPFDFLPVCSDNTVNGEDLLMSSISDLPFAATTDPNSIVSFLSRSNRCVVFATYHSSPILAGLFSTNQVKKFDLVIADESHRCAGSTTGAFATILDEKAINADKRLFMTATPRYFTDKLKKMAGEMEFEIASMDDEKLFGPVFHRLSFSEAIKLGLLSDYQVAIVAVTNELYQKYVEDRKLVTFDDNIKMDARSLASHIGLARAAADHDLKKVISFHGRVKRAKSYSEELPTVVKWMSSDGQSETKVWSKHVSGDMPSQKRDALLDHFKNLAPDVRGFVANARCLSEGVDLPALDGVAFIDPKASELDIIQAVGRAIRKSEDKKIGTIIIPVFVDPNEDSEAILESSPFKTVWWVVRALKAHDDYLAEVIDQFRNQLGRVGTKSLNSIPKITLDIPTRLGADFADAFLVKIVENSTDKWEFWFGLLQRFLDNNGHVNVLRGYKTPKGDKLGFWVLNQRGSYFRGILPKERQRTLETLPGWVWAPRQDWWSKAYYHLLEYVAAEKHALVPQDYKTHSGLTLGAWVNSQRTKFKKGLLTEERKKLLEKLPKWSWNPIGESWGNGLQHLQVFVSENGHPVMTARHITSDGFKLGLWVDAQRQAYKNVDLSEDRIKSLQEIPGWSWDLLEDAWKIRFEKLVQFAKKEGHARVPRKHVTEDGIRLGIWVDNQRHKYRLNKLPLARQNLLEDVKGWSWDPHAAQWEEGFQKLLEFVKEEGTALVPSTYKTNDQFLLGRWIDIQRRFFRNNLLSDERMKRLQGLNGWRWNPLQDVWEKNLRYLQSYVEEFGHARVSGSYVCPDGFGLGSWIERLRQQFRKGKLSEDKQHILEQLPGWAWNPGRKE